jgi:membrane protease YdiL (CAAX protease family)
MVSLIDMGRRVRAVPGQVRVALALTTAMLAYGNLNAVVAYDAREQFLLWSNLGLMAVLVAWALWWARYSLLDVGLSPRAAPGSALVGVVLSVLAATPPVLFIVLAPLFNGDPVKAPEIEERSGAGMAYFLLFRQPVGTALFEEVAFRGVLYGAWMHALGERAAVLITSAAFSVWHVVISSRTIAESGVVDSPPAIAGGILFSLAWLFVGGLIFGYLRWHTRSIAAAVVAHWLIVAAMTVAVWTMG